MSSSGKPRKQPSYMAPRTSETTLPPIPIEVQNQLKQEIAEAANQALTDFASQVPMNPQIQQQMRLQSVFIQQQSALPQQMYQHMPQEVPQEMPQQAHRRLPEQLFQQMHQQTPQRGPQQISQQMSQQMSPQISQQMPREMLQQAHQQLPQLLPQQLSQQMPERLPQQVIVRQAMPVSPMEFPQGNFPMAVSPMRLQQGNIQQQFMPIASMQTQSQQGNTQQHMPISPMASQRFDVQPLTSIPAMQPRRANIRQPMPASPMPSQQGDIQQPMPVLPVELQQGDAQQYMPALRTGIQQNKSQQCLAVPPLSFPQGLMQRQVLVPQIDPALVFQEKLRTFVKNQASLDPSVNFVIELDAALGSEPPLGTPEFETFFHNKLVYWEIFSRFVAENDFEDHNEPQKLIRLVQMMKELGRVDSAFMCHIMMVAYEYFLRMSLSPIEVNRLYGFALMLQQHGLMDNPPCGFPTHPMEGITFDTSLFEEENPDEVLRTSAPPRSQPADNQGG
ncbi:hypothetical protein F5Y05DRAFT_424949 [Hypoxylon sp. FL0543]|nr:hypothetical protein F5Y05DRAFT_424949 [Hypoxylon sp. FL0543]